MVVNRWDSWPKLPDSSPTAISAPFSQARCSDGCKAQIVKLKAERVFQYLSAQQSLKHLASLRVQARRVRIFGVSQTRHDFCLPLPCHRSIASKRGQHIFMAEILAPYFQIFRCAATRLPERYQRFAERVRIEIGEPCIL